MKETKVVPIRYPWAMSYCCMTLVKGEKNILIDTAFEESISPFLEEKLKKEGLTLQDIDLVFNTHSHSDHVEGNEKIVKESSAKVFIHPAGGAAPHIKELAGNVQYFSDGEKISGCTIFFTPGHSADSVCILEENTSTLIIGDSIEGRGSGFAGVALIHDPASYLESIQKIRQLYEAGRVKRVIFSHMTDGFGDEVEGENTGKFLDASEETCSKYIAFTKDLLRSEPEITIERAGALLRENFAVTSNIISPGTADGIARIFLEYCRKLP